ncbi:MAG TPA: GNAT family N-acetyltransferase [Clostridiaceae bacterium]|nr:GNAT family N-acetyltransferase [Clostridiaceae bacterium]
MVEIKEYQEEYAKEMSNIIITNMYEINIKDHGKEIIDKLSKHFTEEEIKKNYPKRIKNYVAIEESEVVGTISINNLRGDTTGTKYIILTLFVKMEKHHQGIGTMLIKKIENYARSVGAKELYIPASIYACEFYRKLGYDYLDGIKEQNEDKEYTLVKYL